MRRIPLALAAALTLAAAAPATAPAKGFSYGVTAGEVTSSSAILWTRSDKRGTVRVELSRGDKRFGRRGDRAWNRTASSSRDKTVQLRATRLQPGQLYYYRFVRGRNRSDIGRFKTAPATNRVQTVTFGLSGDADAMPGPGMTNPFWGTFEVYREMAREGNDFNINLGDTMYSDTEAYEAAGQPDPPVARTVAEKWAKYRMNLAMTNLQILRRTTGFYSHWDDHEFINDFSRAENGSTIYKNGVRAFRDYSPVTYSDKSGIYRKVRWGKNVELFFLDERSFRSAKADDACINPETGRPDLAPTMPQRTRNVFAALVPSLAQPVSQQCLDTIRSPERTFLGRAQMARFKKDVKASTATFKVIVNELPVQQIYALPYDRWEGYEAERQEVLRYLQANVKNVVFLSTDIHGNMVNDARLQTLEEGGPQNTGITDFATGPVGTRTFENQVDDSTGREGNGNVIGPAFFKPQPPDGLGMSCSAIDVYSYAEVKVSAKALTVTLKDQAGQLVREQDSEGGNNGAPCQPVTMTRTP